MGLPCCRRKLARRLSVSDSRERAILLSFCGYANDPSEHTTHPGMLPSRQNWSTEDVHRRSNQFEEITSILQKDSEDGMFEVFLAFFTSNQTHIQSTPKADSLHGQISFETQKWRRHGQPIKSAICQTNIKNTTKTQKTTKRFKRRWKYNEKTI